MTSTGVAGFCGSFAPPAGVEGRDEEACEGVFVVDAIVVDVEDLRS